MCGVIGLLLRDPELQPRLGAMLAPMLEALDERGPDSSGIALYADQFMGVGPYGTGPTLRVSLGADAPVDWMAVGCALLDLCPIGTVQRFGAGAVIELPEACLEQVETALAERWREVRILGTGWNLRVLKDTGRPADTCARYAVRDWEGYLAIAHTRMATESAVTVLHSHPFVPDRDLCVVHNGSFSNYATVRRRLLDENITFDSDNDSEVGARFLATRLALGDSLEEATRWVMKEMDGFFTLVITSADGMSVVRDAFACKPAVVAETVGYVAVASEYRALAELPGIAQATVFEPRPEEVYTWTR
jgi:methylamine---glutamate N-methyltransferase subunit A